MAPNDHAQPTPTPVPDPALKRFEKLVGTWDMQGRTPDATEDNIFGWNMFEWLPGGFFLQSRGEIDFRGFKLHSLELIGYDPASHAFPSRVYSSMSGDISPYYWDVQGDTVTHWMETSKFTGTLSADGRTLTGGWRPLPGQQSAGTVGEDDDNYDVVMTRIE